MTVYSRCLHFIRGLLVLGGFLAMHGLPISSQILPDAPIEGIQVTMFSDEGLKVWNLLGDSATYLENGAVEVKGMDLEVYQGESGQELDMRIQGSEAVYESEERAVHGRGGVFVEGEFYNIEGESWRYSQDDRIVRVTDKVKVVIAYELDAFLK